MAMTAHEAVVAAARQSCGRLVAFIAARSRDLAAAEDALADAFETALRTWPRDGVPEHPEAWLLTAARRRLIDAQRHAQVHEAARPLIELDTMLGQAQDLSEAEPEMFPDERLKLMFVCAHPAIDAASRTPLMLQTVLGLDAATIASAFLVAPAAMGQRLVRAKTKIRDAGIAFEVPAAADLPERLDAVLAGIYAAYGTGWDAAGEGDARRSGLASEAMQLARMLVQLMPDQAEALGLLSLVLYCESRREARRDAARGYVPLSEQDTTRWSASMIEEAEILLRRAGAMQRLGRFQLEAAIQAVHAQRARTGSTRWEVIASLYAGLMEIAPTVGARVGHAAAEGEAFGAQIGLQRLDAIDAEGIGSYQPWWAVRAHLLAQLGRRAEALSAYEQAMGLSEDADVRAFLLRRANALGVSH
ncbi:MAG: RNA polymerase sigma factor [Panacagrimonas sp.]